MIPRPGDILCRLAEFVKNLQQVAGDYQEGKVDGVVDKLMEHALDNEGVKASELEKIIREDENFGYYSDDNGDLASFEIFREALERTGYDGIIDRRAYEKFGPRVIKGAYAGIGHKVAGMSGLAEDTVHYIAFKPTQIKSAIGNKGTFDPSKPSIIDAFDPDEPRGQHGEWTSGGGEETVTFYHGTASENLAKIRTSGIRPMAGRGFKQSVPGLVYLANNTTTAKLWGAAGRGSVAVLEVHVPKSQLANLHEDPAMTTDPADTAFAFNGAVPPEWIKGHYPGLASQGGKLGALRNWSLPPDQAEAEAKAIDELPDVVMTEAEASAYLKKYAVDAYDPDEQRDPHGEWTSGGSDTPTGLTDAEVMTRMDSGKDFTPITMGQGDGGLGYLAPDGTLYDTGGTDHKGAARNIGLEHHDIMAQGFHRIYDVQGDMLGLEMARGTKFTKAQRNALIASAQDGQHTKFYVDIPDKESATIEPPLGVTAGDVRGWFAQNRDIVKDEAFVSILDELLERHRMHDAFDPDESRDEHGEWSGGGAETEKLVAFAMRGSGLRKYKDYRNDLSPAGGFLTPDGTILEMSAGAKGDTHYGFCEKAGTSLRKVMREGTARIITGPSAGARNDLGIDLQHQPTKHQMDALKALAKAQGFDGFVVDVTELDDDQSDKTMSIRSASHEGDVTGQVIVKTIKEAFSDAFTSILDELLERHHVHDSLMAMFDRRQQGTIEVESPAGPVKFPAEAEFETRKQAKAEEKLQEAFGEGEVDVLTAGDDDVCEECLDIADGGPYTLDEAEGLIPAHPNAVLEGSTIASYGAMHEMVSAVFGGPAIYLRTVAKSTTIGPNHPMLTRRGLVKARELREGDELLYDLRTDGNAAAGAGLPDFKKMPLVQDVFVALAAVSPRERVAASHLDLHGDAVFCESKVEVVHPTRQLLPVLDPCGIQQLCELPLPIADADLQFISSLRSC